MSEAANSPVFAGAVPVESVSRKGALVTLTLRPPAAVTTARAGQFAILSPERPGGPLVGTPLSIADTDPLTVLFTVFSPATEHLAAAMPGERIYVTAPLGRPFQAAAAADLIVCDVTHFGTLYALAAERHRAGAPAALLFVLFGSEPNAAEADLIAALRAVCRSVTALTSAALAEALGERADAVIAAGARSPVMATVQSVATARGFRGEAALQTAMACGLGVCKACIWPLRAGGHFLVCEGPTLPLGDPSFEPRSASDGR